MDQKQEVIVLNPVQYAALESKLLPPSVNNVTTPIQAGFMLGVQAVLKLLREGYVSKTNS